jgi:hypothetical protein
LTAHAAQGVDDMKWIFSTVRAFYQNHNRWLPAIGFLIASATFLAHDYFREEANELADSLTRAQDTFKIREEMSSRDRSLMDIQEKVNRLYDQITPSNDIKKTKAKLKTVRYYAINYDLYAEDQLGAESLLSNVRDLRRRLPRDAAFENDIEPVDAALKARSKLIDELHGAVFYNTVLNEQQILRLIGEVSAQRVRMKVVAAQQQHVQDFEVPLAVANLAGDTFFVAEKNRIQAEFVRDFWKTASIWFYAAGFILGFGGRLLGIPTEGGGAP